MASTTCPCQQPERSGSGSLEIWSPAPSPTWIWTLPPWLRSRRHSLELACCDALKASRSIEICASPYGSRRLLPQSISLLHRRTPASSAWRTSPWCYVRVHRTRGVDAIYARDQHQLCLIFCLGLNRNGGKLQCDHSNQSRLHHQSVVA